MRCNSGHADASAVRHAGQGTRYLNFKETVSESEAACTQWRSQGGRSACAPPPLPAPGSPPPPPTLIPGSAPAAVQSRVQQLAAFNHPRWARQTLSYGPW